MSKMRSNSQRKRWGGTRPGSGPKPKPRDMKQSNKIMVSLTDAELDELRETVGDQKLATYIRDLLLKHLARRRRK